MLNHLLQPEHSTHGCVLSPLRPGHPLPVQSAHSAGDTAMYPLFTVIGIVVVALAVINLIG